MGKKRKVQLLNLKLQTGMDHIIEQCAKASGETIKEWIENAIFGSAAQQYKPQCSCGECKAHVPACNCPFCLSLKLGNLEVQAQ